ncbi:hypothetical protein BTJ40_05655 [Microbulbifer sp. A4B17]|uniref:hypothetical protein n=1 Tax=Microbulbifer sp. A4B17 TaxID=359370 RepID=UPI000D52C54C|nr:hypothetical protein [Microbulbifer sp. A4B17]AWF80333.1 hypothetical protein BTJ40_05655 [Microbulbifer sp. A4B17]
MYRFGLVIALILTVYGCEGPKDSKPPVAPADEAATDAMKEPIAPPGDMGKADKKATAICTPEWFEWVQQQVIAQQNGDMANLYPSGMPTTGSEEWFTAISQLSGVDTSGLQPGGMEWCEAIQKHLTEGSGQPLQ